MIMFLLKESFRRLLVLKRKSYSDYHRCAGYF